MGVRRWLATVGVIGLMFALATPALAQKKKKDGGRPTTHAFDGTFRDICIPDDNGEPPCAFLLDKIRSDTGDTYVHGEQGVRNNLCGTSIFPGNFCTSPAAKTNKKDPKRFLKLLFGPDNHVPLPDTTTPPVLVDESPLFRADPYQGRFMSINQTGKACDDGPDRILTHGDAEGFDVWGFGDCLYMRVVVHFGVDPDSGEKHLKCGDLTDDKTTPIAVECISAELDAAGKPTGACTVWQVQPSFAVSPQQEQHVCRVEDSLSRSQGGGHLTVGYFNMPFGLTITRR